MKLLSVWEVVQMRTFWAGSFGALMNNIQLALTSYRATSHFAGMQTSEEGDREWLKGSLKNITPFIDELSLSLSVKNQLERLKAAVDSRPPGEVAVMLEELQRNIISEISECYYLQLNPKERDLYEHQNPIFGDQVAEKFPSLTYEIEEASRCLALQRPTAAAFHLLRVLEGGFAAIWRCLGVSDPIRGYERNWSNRIKRVNEAFELHWPNAVSRSNGDAKIFEQLIGSLTGMQNPYRNATMHLEQVYTEEDAEHLFLLIKGLMKRIASRMDENGQPLVVKIE